MASLYQTMKNCIYKTPVSEQVEVVTKTDSETDVTNTSEEEEVLEESGSFKSNKKTDEMTEPVTQPSLVWRMSSGLYNTATGAVGYSVGGVKWVAGKSYDVGSAVVSNVRVPSLQKFRRKDKKE